MADKPKSEHLPARDPVTPETKEPMPKEDQVFEAPYPGSSRMPRWRTAELVEPTVFRWRYWFTLLGPGLLMGGASIGGGEWLVGPLVTAKYGGGLMWLATLSILAQTLYNIEVSRYTLYCGEPIFTGKFRTLPGPHVWILVYLVLDFGSVFPYLAANAATPLEVVLLGGQLPDPDHVASHWWMHKSLSCAILLLAVLPLIFGGKIYNALKAIMTFKLFTVLGFLALVGVFYSHPSTWVEICTGFVKFGNVPIQRSEDLNGNGRLDAGEDWDGDGHLDTVEPRVDRDGDGVAESWEDLDQDGHQDGDNLDNLFLALLDRGELPEIDFTLMAFIAALAAIAGSGGLSNTTVSNYTRDQGWGMGRHVGAIPSMVGGHGITLSHVGSVFEVSEQVLPRWRGWYRHVLRDQLVIWMPACFIGIALPSMLSVEFLPRGTEAKGWITAAMTAEAVGQHVANPADDVLASMSGLSHWISGNLWGNLFWGMTLLCGFLVLGPSVAQSADGIIRRWVDSFWTSSRHLRSMEPSRIRQIYFRVLVGWVSFSLIMLWLNPPDQLIKFATIGFNCALGFSCWHTLAINTLLLPRPLRPRWWSRTGLVLAGIFFTLLGSFSMLRELGLLQA